MGGDVSCRRWLLSTALRQSAASSVETYAIHFPSLAGLRLRGEWKLRFALPLAADTESADRPKRMAPRGHAGGAKRRILELPSVPRAGPRGGVRPAQSAARRPGPSRQRRRIAARLERPDGQRRSRAAD